MTRLIATTVVHGAEAGQAHGHLYLVDLARQEVLRPFSLATEDIEWYGDEGGRGLRGIALDGDTLFLCASDRLLALDPGFRIVGEWRNPLLADGRGLSIHERKLYVAAAANDCILRFDLDEQVFDQAMQIQSEFYQFKAAGVDPNGENPPLFINKLGLRSLECDEGGLRITGLSTGGVLHFSGEAVRMSVELPEGAQDAVFFRHGVVFNDSRTGVIRYVGQEDDTENRALPVPFFTPSDHERSDPDSLRALKRGYARGMCVLSGRAVAGGSTPAAVSVYDLKEGKKLLTASITRNVLEAVNAVAAWDR